MAVTFDSKGPLNQLATILGTLSGMQTVYKGAPESIGTQVSAYVALGGQRIVDKATGLLQREARYFVGFAYRVEGAEATAETSVADLVDAFIAAVYADRTLAGEVSSMTAIDLSLADSPQYQVVAGQEFRIYPVVVVTTQQSIFP